MPPTGSGSASSRLLDFDDLEEFAIQLLESDSELRTRVQAGFDHILMDELQDTNPLQWKLMRLDPPSRCVLCGWRHQPVDLRLPLCRARVIRAVSCGSGAARQGDRRTARELSQPPGAAGHREHAPSPGLRRESKRMNSRAAATISCAKHDPAPTSSSRMARTRKQRNASSPSGSRAASVSSSAAFNIVTLRS